MVVCLKCQEYFGGMYIEPPAGAYWGDPKHPYSLRCIPEILSNSDIKNEPWSFLIVGLFNVVVCFYLGEKILSFNHAYLIAAIEGILREGCAFICRGNDH